MPIGEVVVTKDERDAATAQGEAYVSTRCNVCGTVEKKKLVASLLARAGMRIECNMASCGKRSVEVTAVL